MKSITSTPESGFGSENWKRVWIYKHNLQVCGFPKTQSISTLSHWLLDMIFHRRSLAHSDQQGMCVVSFDAGVPWITRVSGNTHFNSCHLCCIWGVEGCDEALVWKSDTNRINYCNAVARTFKAIKLIRIGFLIFMVLLFSLFSKYGYILHTLPETNIAPENGWLEYYFPIGEAYFQEAGW